MSSITKKWTEEDFRKELRRIDQHVKETKGINLAGGELDITFSERARCRLGAYYSQQRMFRFSLPFFNSDVPEACAIDVIRHEYAHYYTHEVFGKRGHGAHFKAACGIVGANPSVYYSMEFENAARSKEERDARKYTSSVKTGQRIHHPYFGSGVVLTVENTKESALIKVDFGCQGVRIMDESWLKKNGVI